MPSFGETLKILRENKGLSQTSLAEKIGIRSGKQTISKWELSKGEPSLSELKKIAQILGTSVTNLVEETHDDDLRIQIQDVGIPYDSDIIILIDDPENILHPKGIIEAQRKFLSILEKIGELRKDKKKAVIKLYLRITNYNDV